MNRRLVSTPAGWWAVVTCAALAAAVSFSASGRWPVGVAVMPGAAALCCATAWQLTAMRRLGGVGLVLGAVALGIVRGACAATPSVAETATHRGPLALVGTVREGTGARRSAAQIVVDAEKLVAADGELQLHGGVLASLRNAPRLLPGDHVELDATGLRAPHAIGAEASLPRDGVDAVAISPSATLLSEGGPSPARWLAQTRAALGHAVDGAVAEPAASLVKALAFALPVSLPAGLTASLRDSGLAHMLATSGLKVVLVAGLMGALLSLLAVPPRARLLLMALAVGLYVLLCGASSAAVRSALMALAGWSLYGTGRSADPLPLLTALAAGMLLVAPDLAGQVGFQLTFLGTLGILLFATPIARRLPGPRWLREPFALTLAASAVTVPVMASTFGTVSLVGPFANALAVPLLAPLLVLAGLGAPLAMVAPTLGWLPLQAAGALAGAISTIADASAALPFAALHIANWTPALTVAELAAVATAVGVWWGLRRRGVGVARPRRSAVAAAAGIGALLAGSVVVVAAERPDGRLHVSVLDVGAARAVLVQTPSGDHALVDTASDAQHLLDALGPALPPLSRSLGLLVLTGGDRLGAGGLGGLADRYHVDTAVAPPDLPAAARTTLAALADRGTAVTTAAARSAWTWGGATWRLLTSDALRIEAPTGSALLVGSLDPTAQDELAGIDGDALGADLLVAPPGGALAPALLAAVHPSNIAVPTAHGGRTVSTTLVAGPAVRRTGDSGTLTYAGGDGGLAPT